MTEQEDFLPPKNAYSIVAGFLRYAADTVDLMSLTHDGARALLGSLHLNEMAKQATVQVGEQFTSQEEDRLATVTQKAEVARQELERGFPLLHSHALMGIWGALEAMVADVCVAHALSNPVVLQREPFSKIKVPAVTFLSYSRRQQTVVLLEEAQKPHGTTARIGIEQFEVPLGLVGLNGAVDPDVRNTMRIAKALRNLVAHRAGVVDARFLQTCPDVGLEEGQVVKITGDQMMAVVGAMSMYAHAISNRVRAWEGKPPFQEFMPPWIKSTANLVTPFKQVPPLSATD